MIKEQEEMKDCTFNPEKTAELEFEYSAKFKDPSQRLYNNYFEREIKKKFMRKEVHLEEKQ
jgi:hypothetical protein